jgi:hypothetical protein
MTNSISDGSTEVRDGTDPVLVCGDRKSDVFSALPIDFAAHPFGRRITLGAMLTRALIILLITLKIVGCVPVRFDRNEHAHADYCTVKVHMDKARVTCYHPVSFLGS